MESIEEISESIFFKVQEISSCSENIENIRKLVNILLNILNLFNTLENIIIALQRTYGYIL